MRFSLGYSVKSHIVEVDMIKLSGGKYRSRVILTPEEGTLPTKNRVREAMMSMICDVLDGANVLDCFAGSGALGIEALSRGAKKACFVEASPKAAEIIRKNLQTLKENNGTVLCMDYQAAIARMKEPFDLVFLDPPYAMKESYQAAVNALLQRDLLSKDAAVILEYEGSLEFDDSAFASRRDYTYGKSKVILLRRSL